MIGNYKLQITNYKAFTLIELLVVISIIGILVGLSIFGLQGARESARDGTRKSDLELIRSGLELYKSDCNSYPIGSGNPSTVFTGGVLRGTGANPSCAVANIYIAAVPADPSPSRNYRYWSDGVIYEICAATEGGTTTVTCGGSSSCGSTCNHKVTNP